jgi:hypothetical protein
MSKHESVSPVARRAHALPWFLAALAWLLCTTAAAQGFPGGGGHGGGHGGHGAPPDAGHRAAPADANKPPEMLELLLRSAHALRQSLMLDATQTLRWAEMQDDLRDALDKQKALRPKPVDTAQVPNPALLYVQDLSAATDAYAASLAKLAKSTEAAFGALDEHQRKTAIEQMSASLSAAATP